VKIADFGIAIAASPHRGGGTGPRKVMGKWRYMSPEQARGDTLDTRSDLFSAASVMFELFTGEKLFPGDEAEDIIKNIETMPIPKMAAIRPGLPSRLDDVLGLALARKPIDRPSRPAAILRSLIELSYESSIMATALDVAEAVATVLPTQRQNGRGALDDVIRRQLADQSIARRTAVTDGKPSAEPGDPPPLSESGEIEPTSTGLFRKTDSDGLSRLEEAGDPALTAPNAARPPASRAGELRPQVAGDPKDRDRRTEVGEPPTGQGKSDLTGARPRSQRRGLAARGAGVWIALAAGFAAAGGLTTWRLTRPASPASLIPVIASLPREPGPIETRAMLELDSIPPGALVTIADRPIGPAPRKAPVPGGVKVHVKFELKGYQPYEDDLAVESGKTVVVRPHLSAAPAGLRVETTPAGASVTLAGQLLGATPLTRSLPPARGAELVIARPGYESIKLMIELAAGDQTSVVRELRELQKFGVVLVQVGGAADWGYVWYRGRNLGQNYTMAGGQTPFKLPIGRQLLRIEHPQATAKTITVEVVEQGPNRVIVTL